MKRIARRLLTGSVALLLLLLSVGSFWLMGTESGLQWTWQQVQTLSGGRVSAEGVEGTLAGILRIRGLTIEVENARVDIGAVAANWVPTALLGGTLKLKDIDAEQVRVVTRQAQQSTAPAKPFELPVLPLKVALEQVDVRDVKVEPSGGRPIELERVTLSARLSGDALELSHLGATGPDGTVRVQGRVGRAPAQPLDLSVAWSVSSAPLVRPVSGTGHIGGRLASPQVAVDVVSPFRAEARADVQWMNTPLAWNGKISLEGLRPAQLNPQWPAVSLQGSVEGKGGAQSLQVSGTGSATDAPGGAWWASWVISRDGVQWRVPEVKLSSGKGGALLRASGSWRQAGGITDVADAELRVDWQRLRWPIGNPGWASPEGHLKVTGRPDDYRLGAAAQITGLPVGPSRWEASGAGSLAGMELDKVHGALLAGAADGTATVHWKPSFRWSGHIALTGIDPGTRWPQWRGRLGARLASKGALGNGGPAASLTIENLDGQLRGYPVSGQARVELEGERLKVQNLRLSSGTARLTASGSVGKAWNVAWDLKAPDLSHVAPDIAGSLTSEGGVSGPRKTPSIKVSAEGARLAWAGRRVAALKVDADVDTGGGRPWKVEASAGGMVLNTPARLRAVRIHARGRPEAHRIVLESDLEDGSARLTVTGALGDDNRWSGTLREGRIRLQRIEWTQDSPTALAVSTTNARLESWCWSHGSRSRLCLSGQKQKDAWSGRLSVSALPLQQFSPWLPGRELTLVGDLSGQAAVSASAGKLERLNVDLRSSDGRLEYALEQQPLSAEYRQLSLRIDGASAGLDARASVELGPAGSLRASARLPGWVPGSPMHPEQPLRAQVSAALQRTDWLGVLLPDVVISGGVLRTNLNLTGTVADPSLSGQGRLQGAKVALPALGITLEDFRFSMQPAAGAATETTIQVRSGPGELKVQGRFELSEQLGAWGWKGSVSGQRFEALKLPLGRALASPELDLDIAAGRVRVAGRVDIPEAKIRLPELPEGSVQASPDVVVLDRPAQEERERKWRVETDVNIAFGKQVQVEGYGFSGRLGGSLRVVEGQPGAALAEGEVRILDGRYEAYGQKLTITEGRLFYASMPLDNPGLDFRAVRNLQDITVGIRVGGRLQSPEVTLFSDPPMEESDQLAYLILGRPLSSASQAEAGSLQNAATSLGLAGGGRIARQIGAQFGLDVVEVGAESDIAGTEQAALVLGKYLSPRLYIQYAVGIWEAVNTVRVRYQLGRHWVLEAASGPQSSTDLLYSIER